MKFNIKKILGVSSLALVALSTAACTKKDKINNETTPLVFSTQELDGVFNPFFASSGTDSSIVGMTQISMLSSDKDGKVAYGKDEAVVVLDYEQTTEGSGDNEFTTYKFVLKNNIRFSDEKLLSIKDVLFNLYVYLDPVYTGSATIYSTDIVGLKEYRTQTVDQNEQDNFEKRFANEAQDRIDALKYALEEVIQYGKDNDEPTLDEIAMKTKLIQFAKDNEGYDKIVSDYTYACELFKKELNSDFNNNMATFEENKLKNDVEAFLYAEGYIKIDKKKTPWEYIYTFGENSSSWTREQAINAVYADKVPNSLPEIIYYWATATELKESFAAEAKEKYFNEIGKAIGNISGIKFDNHLSNTVVNGKTYVKPEYNTDGTIKNSFNEVLSIKIKGVDPKAIWNFGLTIAPMHYYSSAEQVSKFDFVTNFGVEYSSKTFMDTHVKASNKIGLPMGAGPYKCSNKNGNDEGVISSDFLSNNVVYFQRNDFYLMGAPKIKYIRYQVISQNQLLRSLYDKQIDYAEPNAKTEVIRDLDSKKDQGFGYETTKTSGYGYIGINAAKVSDINVRRAFMHAMDTQLCINYYPGYAERIFRPITKVSWAYPKDVTEEYYKFDDTGVESKKLIEQSGYRKNADGKYEKDGKTIKYTFTIAGDSQDHPAYATLRKASDILNNIGCDITVMTDANTLKKLSSGALSIWAAAWSSTIDPDMYQVYHMESKATSTLNWGYKTILNFPNLYPEEIALISELSDLIDQGRSSLKIEERQPIYFDALDKIMELAVELPTYQRQDLFAYNSNKIDVNSLTKKSELSPYNGPVSKIWEISLNESK